MVFVPNVLEARAALDQDTSRQRRDENQRLPRQDPLDQFFSSLFGFPGDDDTLTATSTTRRTTSTTVRGQTTQTALTSTNTRSTSTTATRSSTSSTSSTRSASLVTNAPPVLQTHSTSTVTSTSTQPASTANADANLASNANSKTGLPSVVVGVIVAASVIFGLILIALIVRKFFQLRRRRRRGTWARGSLIAPFEPPLQEKALPPPPPTVPADTQNRQYPAYPPTAVTFANNPPYSPAVPSSAGFAAPYSFGGNAAPAPTTTAGMFNKSAYTPNDLAGPIVITPPTPSITATAGNIHIVKRTFVPSLPDELSIANGDQVRVLSAYDDGWALCEKVVGGDKGVVPQECLESMTSSNSNAPQQQVVTDEARLNRASSLRRGQDQTY